jgi:hypothetical protein
MGYYSTVSGAIHFDPAISHEEASRHEVIAKYLNNSSTYTDIELRTYHGFLLDTIESSYENEFKAYGLVNELKELIQALGTGRTYSGYLEILGEGHGGGEVDLWRLKVKDGKVVEVRPELVWPSE